ncbi:hypothetical protein FDX19_15510 [Citrobacter sp. wls619]|uniref:hypothetical protein n=1 Tax=Citrobacter sp. wls619 TaxID=2576432 RepID=UPI00113AA7CF|nr:hypothetical protein [Citrobacter sp. wls619]TKV08243.1 hypothetical protein FDX19_15510 [Citrobacter sp. wls619]
MQEGSFQKIIKSMKVSELTELLAWCSHARGITEGNKVFIKKINSENSLTINLIKNELRARNERIVEKSKEMVFRV